MNPVEWFDLSGHRFYVVASYTISFAVVAWMAAATWLRDRRVRREVRAEISTGKSAA